MTMRTIFKNLIIIWLPFLFVLSSCTLKKRVYRQGYFVEWGTKNKKIEQSHLRKHIKSRGPIADTVEKELNEVEELSLAIASTDGSLIITKKNTNIFKKHSHAKNDTLEANKKKTRHTKATSDKIETKKRWPKWWLYIIFALTGAGFYWAFKNPEEAFVKGKKRNYVIVITCIYIAISLLGFLFGSSMLTPWMFVYLPLLFSVIFRDGLRKWLGKAKLSPWFRAVLCGILLIVPEIALALDIGYSIATHLLTFMGLYVGLMIVFLLFYRKDKEKSFSELYTIGGILGVIFEQNFLGPILLLSGNIFGFLLFAIIIFQVYGLYLAAPKLLFNEELKNDEAPTEGNKPKKKTFLKSVLFLLMVTLIVAAVWLLVLFSLGFMGLIVI